MPSGLRLARVRKWPGRRMSAGRDSRFVTSCKTWRHRCYIKNSRQNYTKRYAMLSLFQLDMYLWNTDAPGGNKVKLWQKSLSPTFWPRPTPQGHVMSVKCEQPLDELTVQVLLLYDHPNFKYCTLFISRTELQTDGRTDKRTDDPNTRCPRRTFQAGGIKILNFRRFEVHSYVVCSSMVANVLQPD